MIPTLSATGRTKPSALRPQPVVLLSTTTPIAFRKVAFDAITCSANLSVQRWGMAPVETAGNIFSDKAYAGTWLLLRFAGFTSSIVA
jgi:hypothetical protein